MQSVSSRIWTRVAVSISNDDNHYTTGTSCLYIKFAILNVLQTSFTDDGKKYSGEKKQLLTSGKLSIV